ncbi:JAB-like toxin 1 domain-containing protein [Chitinophaga terrae (ex Kim and Jung 2007)]|uniref:JAB-like toxin 1 domain-containing protein n=1 Tax=Chitinophaga terrae (ex Kim and Jung 2007) TaxID=408074 RepID=UPI0027D7C7B7|nr:JAB-like toxin 1 domain-containing protein [Chitinophaga terrae (ex Kim and Jung 2007)]
MQDGSLTHYNVYQSGNKSEAMSLFKFAANNTNVEWGLNRFADGQNFITTTHNPTGNQGSFGLFFDKSLNITSPLVEQDHSHPGGVHEPSGRVPEGSTESRGGDIANAKYLDRMYPGSTIKYNIYTPSDGRMTPYTSKTSMPPLPEIIIRPQKDN